NKLHNNCRIQDLKKLLFGTSHKETIKMRCLYMRGLFDKSIFSKLKKVFTRKKHISEIIDATSFRIKKALKGKVSDGIEKGNKSRSTRQDKRFKENRKEKC
ncbi:19493_t:CDS:2, partial [Gigaspora margarita]